MSKLLKIFGRKSKKDVTKQDNNETNDPDTLNEIGSQNDGNQNGSSENIETKPTINKKSSTDIQSNGNGKQEKTSESVDKNVDVQNNNTETDQKSKLIVPDKTHPESQTQLGVPDGSMGSKETTKRLQQLMKIRNTNDQKAKSFQALEKTTDSKPEERRGSDHTKQKSRSVHVTDEEQKAKSPSESKDEHQPKQKFRVDNEIFELYEYYQPTRVIGSGAYSVVCEAIDTRTNKKVAIKKNKNVFDHISDARRILREIKLLMHLKHQDIIDMINVVLPSKNEIDSFNDVYLVMPKIDTTLTKVINSKQKLSDSHIQSFVYQILRGLKYIHSTGVAHRDLKPDNILVNISDCKLKITDYGLARGVCKDEIEKPTEYVVTRWYRSPEVMCSAGYYDEKIDIWSVGCIFAELILRKPLFPGPNYIGQLQMIFDFLGTPTDLEWIRTPEAKRWVQKLEPSNGKDLDKIFDKATPQGLDLLKKMLVLDPKQRISAKDALEHPYVSSFHKPQEEIDGIHFETSFEFENSIKTKFGVRHMMYESLVEYRKQYPDN